jgi:hypothetical protein
MLKEEARTKLDGIVSQMETNGEKPEDIQFVVNDFKKNYDVPEAPQEPSLGARIKSNFDAIGDPASDNAKTPTTFEKGASVLGRTIGAIGSIPIEALKSIQPKNAPLITDMGVQRPEFLKKIPEAMGKFSEQHPRAATNIESAVNIAGSLPVGKIVSGVAPKIGIGMAEGLDKAAARIQGTKVKINSPEFKKGAQNEMYTKHEVFGNAEKVREQWKNKIDDTYNQVKERIQNVPDGPENYASIDDIFSEANKAAAKYGKSKTEINSINRSLESLKAQFKEAYPDGQIHLLDAQTEKQIIGKKGDWLARSGEISGNPDAATNSQAHNALYDALKTNVENKGAPGIKELNKQLSEFIPMERSAAKQVLVSNRKNLIPLDAFIGGIHSASSAAGGNLLPAAMTVATLGTRSPLVAKGLHGASKLLGTASQPLGKKVVSEKPLIGEPTSVPLPSRSAVPAYFRKGFNPEKANEAAQAATSDMNIKKKYFLQPRQKGGKFDRYKK